LRSEPQRFATHSVNKRQHVGVPVDRRFRRTRSTRRVSSVRKSVATHRLVVSRLDSAGIGQQLSGFHNARPLKPIKQSTRCDDKRRLRVALLKRVVFAMELGIGEERQNPTSQARQQ
jgi:hypothetical protein